MEINAKNDTFERNDIQIKSLSDENKYLKAKVENLKENEIKCKNCDKKFKSEVDLNNHMITNHAENSNQCINCSANSQKMENMKCLLGRLQGMSKEFMDEKKKHKEICVIASKCSHELPCPKTCYFNDKSYVESEYEDSEDEIDVDKETDSDFVSDLTKPVPDNKCKECNFEGKNSSGLKVHMNTDHKIKCDKCGFRITTKTLIKKHMKEFHVFVT